MRANRDEQGGAEWRPPAGRWQIEDGQAMLAALAASGQTPSAFARAKGWVGNSKIWLLRRQTGTEIPSMNIRRGVCVQYLSL